MWAGVGVLALAAGYWIYEAMPTGYQTRGSQELTPAWSGPARVAAGVGVAGLFGAVALGLRHLTRPHPNADRGLAIAAWAGWAVVGAVLAVGLSFWEAMYTFNALGHPTNNFRVHADWGVVRGMAFALAWAGLVAGGLLAWRRVAAGPNPALPATGSA
jgi:hypothetical protein